MKSLRIQTCKKYIIFVVVVLCFCTMFSVVTGAAESEYSVKVVKERIFVGDEVEFEFSGCKSAADWVGLCKSDVTSYSEDNFGIWMYLGTGLPGDVAPVTDVVASGKYSLKTTLADSTNLPAGEYSIVMMSDDSFNEVTRCNFEIVELPQSSSIPKVENISISDNNHDLKFSLPESCSVNDGYSVQLYWGDNDFKTLEAEPFYSFDLSDKSSVELTFDSLDKMPENAESINVYLVQYGVVSEEFASIKLNKTFIPLVIPESEKSFSTAEHTEEKGDKIFDFLSSFSIWIVLVFVVAGTILFFVFKFKKTKNKAEKNEF